jgi:hypothetical protein
MPQVVANRDRSDEVVVETQSFRDCPGDGRDVKAVLKTRADVIVLRSNEDLRLSAISSRSLVVNNGPAQ